MSNNDTINLFEVGCLVNLRIGCWSGRRMVSRSDLVSVGMDPDALPKDLVNYGRKLLINRTEIQKLSRIEQRARAYLSSYSVPFGVASAHFVPSKMIPDIEQNLNSMKEEFEKAVDSFILRFEESREEVRINHPEFYEKCLKKYYPSSPETLREKFKFSWFLFKISGINALEEVTSSQVGEANQRNQMIAETMKKEVGGFVDQYVSSMREEVVKFCDLMTARINGKAYGDESESKLLTARSLSYFKKYVDRFKVMNIFNDHETNKMLQEFKDQFLDGGCSPKTYDSDAMKSSVSLALSSIRKQASLENEQTSIFINSLKRKVVI